MIRSAWLTSINRLLCWPAPGEVGEQRDCWNSRSRWAPGWLLGFSDITALLLARLASGYEGCVHGPLLTTLAAEPEWSRERLRRLLFGEAVPDLKGRAGGGGQVSGPLLVANLTVASHLLGSPWMPDLRERSSSLKMLGKSPTASIGC